MAESPGAAINPNHFAMLTRNIESMMGQWLTTGWGAVTFAAMGVAAIAVACVMPFPLVSAEP